MSTDMRDKREDSDKARRRKDFAAAFRTHPVLMPTAIGIGVFICVVAKLYGRHSPHGWWTFPIAAGCALLVVGLALWLVRRTGRTDDTSG